jgi:hypothetical protein
MNHSTIKAQIYMSATWYSAESILFHSWPLGVMRGYNRVKHIYICFNGENLLKISSRYHWAKKLPIYLQGDLMAIKKSNFVCVYMGNISQCDSGVECGPWASCLKRSESFKHKIFQLTKSEFLWFKFFCLATEGSDFTIVPRVLEKCQFY